MKEIGASQPARLAAYTKSFPDTVPKAYRVSRANPEAQLRIAVLTLASG